jgi:hypothetical protein
VTSDAIFRAACICAAAAVGAWPYRQEIRFAAERAAEAIRAQWGVIGRVAVIGLLFAAAWGKLPTLPALPASIPSMPITVEVPSVEMQQKVRDVAAALTAANPVDRAVWASVWEKAAVVVSAPEGDPVIFTDTRSLRGFTVLSLDIAWRRLAGNPPGKYVGLKEAVEKVMGEAIGLEVRPVTPELRKAYAEACMAIAWAGIHKGG